MHTKAETVFLNVETRICPAKDKLWRGIIMNYKPQTLVMFAINSH